MKATLGVILCILSLALLASGTSYGQTTPTLITEVARMERIAENLGEPKVIDKMSAELTALLGNNAKAVVAGLREGVPIRLTGVMPGGQVQAPVTIRPPTSRMGLGDVFISLQLGKQQLSQIGIAQPTPAQLQAALVGGSIPGGNGVAPTTTRLPGILAMRGQNMGWGQIAHALGLKLSTVVAGLKTVNHSLLLQAASPNRSDLVNAKGQSVAASEVRSVAPGRRPGAGAGQDFTRP